MLRSYYNINLRHVLIKRKIIHQLHRKNITIMNSNIINKNKKIIKLLNRSILISESSDLIIKLINSYISSPIWITNGVETLNIITEFAKQYIDKRNSYKIKTNSTLRKVFISIIIPSMVSYIVTHICAHNIEEMSGMLDVLHGITKNISTEIFHFEKDSIADAICVNGTPAIATSFIFPLLARPILNMLNDYTIGINNILDEENEEFYQECSIFDYFIKN